MYNSASSKCVIKNSNDNTCSPCKTQQINNDDVCNNPIYGPDNKCIRINGCIAKSDNDIAHCYVKHKTDCVVDDKCKWIEPSDGSVDYVYTFSTPGTYCARAVSSAFTSSPPNEYPGEMYFGIFRKNN